jgi:hypothetical protein
MVFMSGSFFILMSVELADVLWFGIIYSAYSASISYFSLQIKFMGNKEEISCHIIKENLRFVKKYRKSSRKIRKEQL